MLTVMATSQKSLLVAPSRSYEAILQPCRKYLYKESFMSWIQDCYWLLHFRSPGLLLKSVCVRRKDVNVKEERNLIQTVIHDDLHEAPHEILDQSKHPSFLSR